MDIGTVVLLLLTGGLGFIAGVAYQSTDKTSGRLSFLLDKILRCFREEVAKRIYAEELLIEIVETTDLTQDELDESKEFIALSAIKKKADCAEEDHYFKVRFLTENIEEIKNKIYPPDWKERITIFNHHVYHYGTSMISTDDVIERYVKYLDKKIYEKESECDD